MFVLYLQSRLLATAAPREPSLYMYPYFISKCVILYMHMQVLLTRAQDPPQCVPLGCWTTPPHSRELPHYQSPHVLSEKMKGGRATGIWLLTHASTKPFSTIWNSVKSGIVAIQAGLSTCRYGHTQVAFILHIPCWWRCPLVSLQSTLHCGPSPQQQSPGRHRLGVWRVRWNLRLE